MFTRIPGQRQYSTGYAPLYIVIDVSRRFGKESFDVYVRRNEGWIEFWYYNRNDVFNVSSVCHTVQQMHSDIETWEEANKVAMQIWREMPMTEKRIVMHSHSKNKVWGWTEEVVTI